jgi:hypothetical protein
VSIDPEDVGKRAVVRFADGTVRARGEVLAHSLVPSVLIKTDDGERVWWRCDMGEVQATPCRGYRIDDEDKAREFVRLCRVKAGVAMFATEHEDHWDVWGTA